MGLDISSLNGLREFGGGHDMRHVEDHLGAGRQGLLGLPRMTWLV